MGKIQISSLSSRSCILCRLASGSWGEKLIWDMESWDIQKLRARLCLTFRLNHELDTSNSLCCMLLFAKLAETLSNSEIVPNKIFFSVCCWFSCLQQKNAFIFSGLLLVPMHSLNLCYRAVLGVCEMEGALCTSEPLSGVNVFF